MSTGFIIFFGSLAFVLLLDMIEKGLPSKEKSRKDLGL